MNPWPKQADPPSVERDRTQALVAQWVTAHNEAGLRTLVARLRVLRPTLVVLEATGGRDVPLVAALAEAALPVAVVKARQVRDVALAIGQLAKTDALDAQVLARFTEVLHPTPRPVPDAQESRARRQHAQAAAYP